jgi:hypothetical protein
MKYHTNNVWECDGNTRFLKTIISTHTAYMWEYKLENQVMKNQRFMQKNVKCKSM